MLMFTFFVVLLHFQCVSVFFFVFQCHVTLKYRKKKLQIKKNIIVIVVVVVVLDDDTFYWVYLSSDHPFQVYYKVRQFNYYKVRQVLLQSATYYYQVRQNMTTDTRRPICHQMTILSKYGHFTSQLKRTKKFFSRRRKWRQNPASCPQILGNPVSRHAEFGGCYQPRPKINLL